MCECPGHSHDCCMTTSHASFTDQLHEIWRTRPFRLPDKGPVAGVAAGIGYRYGIDPVVVRVAFVVSTIFGGAGIVLYLAGWLFLNQAGDQSSAAESLFGKGQSSESHTKSIVLVVALAIAVTTMGPIGVGMGGSGLVSAGLMLAGLWLLHQRQPTPPPPPLGQNAWSAPGIGFPSMPFPPNRFGPAEPNSTSVYGPYTTLPDHYEPEPPAAEKTPPVASASDGPSLVKEMPRPETQARKDTERLDVPPSWDPLGVAPFAWDLPEPATPAAVVVAPPRTRSRLTPLVIGLALLATAATGAAAVAGADWLTPGRIGAVALAVVGAGLIVGAFLRRGYGLLVVTGPLIGFVVLASLIGPLDFNQVTLGERDWRPANVADLEAEYSVLLGSGQLDLRGLDLTEDRTIAVDAQLGEIEVILPENMNVRKNSTIFAGETTGLPDGLDGGADGTDGPVLTLDINTRMGSVEVHRG